MPAILLAVMAVWAYLVLSDNEALASDRMVVNVTAEQFAGASRTPAARSPRATFGCRSAGRWS